MPKDGKYDRQTATFLGRVGENMPELSTEEMQFWQNKPKEIQRVLRVFKDSCKPKLPFPIFKTIMLGNFESTNLLINFLKLGIKFEISEDHVREPDKNWSYVCVNDEACQMIKRIKLAQSPTLINLYAVSVSDLKLHDPNFLQIHQAAEAFGLKRCPAEVGPQLRIQYLQQPEGEKLIVCMHEVKDDGGSAKVFSVKNFNGSWNPRDKVLKLDDHYNRSDEKFNDHNYTLDRDFNYKRIGKLKFVFTD